MLEPVGLAPERETAGVVQDAVQHRRGEGPVPHELLPLRDLLVGGEDHRRALVRVGDEAEEAVRLRPGSRRECWCKPGDGPFVRRTAIA